MVTKPDESPSYRKGGNETRQRILEVALELFSERGFSRTSIRDIAHRAGVTDPALYYYFASKQQILDELFDATCLHLDQAPADYDFEQTAQHSARCAIRLMNEHREFFRLLFAEGLSGDTAAREQLRTLNERWERGLVKAFGRGREPGVYEERMIRTRARLLIRNVVGSFVNDLFQHESDGDRSRYYDLVNDLREEMALTIPPAF